ncbi:calcium-binding protein [Leptospira interrogans]
MTGLGSVGDAAGDTLANIENLTGSDFDDVLEGNGGNNVLTGSTNGSGGDTASYANALAAVTVSLATTLEQNTLGAGKDMLLGFENLGGSAFSDKLKGSSLANILAGGAGSDVITGGAGNDTLQGGADDDILIGGAGADALDGGTGNDTASYATSTVAVTVDLAAGTGLGGDAQGDTLTNVENLIGSSLHDILTGDGNDNVLTGGAGKDTLTGGLGDDILIGGTSADILNGTDGSDTASYACHGRPEPCDRAGRNRRCVGRRPVQHRQPYRLGLCRRPYRRRQCQRHQWRSGST